MQLNCKADDVEDIREYTQGGYAVIGVGKVLGKKYEVVDKLGHGDSATVWLCWIKGTVFPRMEWVAVKVFKSRFAARPSHEMKKRKELITKGGWEREWVAAHVGMPIEEFHHAGPNGLHRCLAMPLLGASLESLDLEDRPTLKRYLYQTALALQYLHKYDVAHGAVEPSSIRFQLDLGDLNMHIKEQMKVVLGLEARKRRTNAKTSDSVPSELICPADLRKLSPRGKIVLFPSKRAEFIEDVPRWYQAPEVLTGLNRGPGGDVWSFCCTVLDVYAKCSLGLAQINSESQLMEHVKILERFLGPLRPPSGHVVDDDGNIVKLIPPRRMCETEEEYEKWKRYACVPPWTSSPMKALLGSDWFRKHFAPKPIKPEAALSELEAGELGTLLESALCYDEPRRSIRLILESTWFSSLHSRRRKPMQLEKTATLTEDSPYKYVKETEKIQRQNGNTQSEGTVSLAQEEHHTSTKKVANPLLEIPLDKELDLNTLLRLTHGVNVSVEKEFILGREDLGHRRSPGWKVENAHNELPGAKNRPLTRAKPLEHYILNVCRAYRDHCDWANVRVKLLSLRARDSELYDNDTYWCELTMKKIKGVLEEHAKYRAARLEFYRQEIRNTSSVQLRMDMVLEFPDLRGGELSLYELLRLKSQAESDDEKVAAKLRKASAQVTTRNTEEGHQGSLASIPEDTTHSSEIAGFAWTDTCSDEQTAAADDGDPEILIIEESGRSSRDTQRKSDMAYQKDYGLGGLAVEAQTASRIHLPDSTASSPTSPTLTASIIFTKARHTKVGKVAEAVCDRLNVYTDEGRRRGFEVAEAASGHLKQIHSTVEGLLEPHLRRLVVGLESGDLRVYCYLLTGAAISLLFLAILLTAAVGLLMVRGSSSAAKNSIGDAAGSEAALDWFQARVASPYSSLYEGMFKNPSSSSQNRKIIDESMGLEMAKEETSLRGYLVTRFSNLT